MHEPPQFWSHDRGALHPLALLLAPVSALYDIASKMKRRLTVPVHVDKPVICIGNVTLGGVGKTPFVTLVAARLSLLGVHSHIVSRGYGGQQKTTTRVDVAYHNAADVGDEALLHACHAPTWVGRNRPASAMAAIDAGAECVLLDDGFQNPSLAKDFSFLLIDADNPFGNGKIFPAGPLRETPEDARNRASAIVFVKRRADEAVADGLRRFARGLPIIEAWVEPDASQLDASLSYSAFCGIGKPEKFFQSLQDAKLNVATTKSFPDHHPFTRPELQALFDQAQAQNLTLITTEKDFQRLPADFREKVVTLPIAMVVHDEAVLDKLLSAVVQVGVDLTPDKT